MNHVKKLCVAFAALLVLGSAMTAMASAAETDPLFLLVTNTAFKGTGPAGELTVEGNPFGVTCTSAAVTGAVGGNDKETFTATVEFKGCSANSLGDAAKIILFKADGLLCWIKKTSPLEVGLYILSTEAVHLENILIIGLVDFAVGSSQIAQVTPVNTKTRKATLELKKGTEAGKQKITSCLDLEVTLKPAIKVTQNHAGAEKGGAIEQTLTIEPTTAGEEWQIDG